MRTVGREEVRLEKPQMASGQTGCSWAKTAVPSITLLRDSKGTHPCECSSLCACICDDSQHPGLPVICHLDLPRHCWVKMSSSLPSCCSVTLCYNVSHCVTMCVLCCIGTEASGVPQKSGTCFLSRVTFITRYHYAWYNVKDCVECVEMVFVNHVSSCH